MKLKVRPRLIIVAMGLWACGQFAMAKQSAAQERMKIAYSADNSTNVIWYSALDTGIYKKYGLDVELIFIPSSTTTVLSVVAGDIQVANTSGGVVASAAVGGANLVLTACYINTLPYELVVNESIRSSEDLRGKNIGISRLGSSSDVAARVLVRGLGLEPVKDVAILQVGGSSERASAFRTGRIAGFPSPPGIIHLAQGMPHRILISTADFKKRYDFPFICSVMSRNFLQTRRDTVKRITMALIETTHFLKTRKEESKKLIGKYARQYNPQFLEASYNAMVKLHDRIPLVTREGTQVQINEALSRRPGATLKIDDLIEDSVVRELEKSGFIEQIYKWATYVETKNTYEIVTCAREVSWPQSGQLANLIKAQAVICGVTNRIYAFPPGTPKLLVQTLRKGFIDTLRDPEFVADAKKSKLEIDPIAGEDVEREIKGPFNMEPALIDKLKEILKWKAWCWKY